MSHIGYETPVDHALAVLLGQDFWLKDLNLVCNVPFMEIPSFVTGAVEYHPLRRRCVVVEGNTGPMGPMLQAIAAVRMGGRL